MPSLEIPAYFVVGRFAYTVSYPVAGDEHSAHSPAFEKPELMRRILQADVPNGRVTMADQAKR